MNVNNESNKDNQEELKNKHNSSNEKTSNSDNSSVSDFSSDGNVEKNSSHVESAVDKKSSEVKAGDKTSASNKNDSRGSDNKDDKKFDRNKRKSGNRRSNETSDLMQSVLSVRRVTRIVKGGARFSFSILAIVGDGQGKIGIGKGKDKELSNARAKAVRQAKNRMFKISLKKNRTLHHDIKYKYCSSIVLLKSAKLGTGIIAGGVLRNMCECLGIKDIVAKAYGSTNKYNMLFAAIEGLKLINSPKRIAERRGINTLDLLKKKKIDVA